MATESFDKSNPAPDAPADAEIVKAPSAELTTKVSQAGAVGLEDLAWARLNCVNPSSKYDVDGASDGDIVFEKELVVVPVGSKGKLIVVHRSKKWKDNVPYGSSEIATFYHTQQEAAQAGAGGSTYDIIPYADIAGLLEWDPEGPITLDEARAMFPFEVEEKRYALVQYSVQKKRAVEENYAKVRTMELASGGLWNTYVHLYTKEKNFQGNTWFQFMAGASGEPVPQETADFIQSLSELG